MDSLPGGVRLDARAVRVLAHPLRTRLLSALRLDGPATATSLARTLGTNSGATSYHLRRLAEVGLVTDADGGTGRERRWRAAHESHGFTAGDVEDSPDARAAQAWLRAEYQRQYQAWAQAWLAHEDDYPLAWRDAAGSSDFALDLTAEQLAALLADLTAVVARYRTAPPPAGHNETRPVLVVLHAFPRVPGGEP
ncbi:ArsR/SmtB family transcription factor [Georgenia ruanii]|uniref:Helix-turn-helix domain-containing protein n=1 Tax=Georgenia ruanii TaxID=348442 RepID=A0A7J9UR41_9MICO|nr:helix-turn-helix domain-containing protein [Georgenia ruanii]MPV87069.1 helix-turn-helix domain-containing protein [Georgenia ruanii]